MTYKMPSSIRCVVWDWNGTIYDDARICQDITNQQLEQLGLRPLPYETQEILFRHPVEEYYVAMGATFQPGQFEKLSEEFHDEYGRQRKNGIVKDNVIALLTKIKEKDIHQIVLSAYRENDLQSLVSECGLTGYFDAVLGLADCHAVSKVDRGVSWLREQGFSPEEVLVIGDTNHDFEVAQEMGAHVVLLPSGYQHINLLIQTGASVVENLSEISVKV